MPYPYEQDCRETLAGVDAAAGRLREAIERTTRLCTSQTWQGPPADRWYSDYRELLRPILAVLDAIPVERGVCLAEARSLQARSLPDASMRAPDGGRR